MAKEKRLHPRRYWRTRINFEDEFGDGIIYLYSRDISLGGLYLDETPPFKMGTQLFLSFVLPGKKRPLRLTGQVVRIVEHTPEGKPKVGAGIRFSQLPEKALKQLVQFLH